MRTSTESRSRGRRIAFEPSLHDLAVRIPWLLVLAVLLPIAAPAQTVSVERGNVVYRASRQAPARRLTTLGRDRDARLSPDRRTVVFVRATPGDSVDAGSGRAEASELWTVRTDGSGARMLVRGRGSTAPERILVGFQSPQFSPDGRQVYFLSDAWAVSSAVHAVELATGRERYLIPGNSLEVVPNGRYAGHLLVSQHRYFLVAGSFDWVWLFTPAGREVGPVGETQAAIDEFREMYVRP